MAKFVRILWVPVLLTSLYTGWVFWQRRALTPPPSQAAPDPTAAYGTSVKILEFYTNAKNIGPGEKVLMCYGVVNAKTVQLQPPAEDVWPSLSRCFQVAPRATTRYTLTAMGADRTTVSQSVEVVVKRPVHPSN